MPLTMTIHIPAARFRSDDELPAEVDVEVVPIDTRPTYDIHPTREVCARHHHEPLLFVEISTGESGLWCPECTTSQIPAIPHKPHVPYRSGWRRLIADLRGIFRHRTW